MTGLIAIVDRELRQTVRRRAIYRLRWLGVAGAVVLSVAILLSHLKSGSAGTMGRDVLTAMVLLCFGFSLLVGPLFAADSISEEKREGTLGLLMLTPLRGYEVVAGKLVASFMPCLQILLAVVPVFSLGFFIGGVAYGELGRALLLLSITLTLSLSVSLATSCLVRRAISTMAMSFAFLLLLVLVIPLMRYDPGPGAIAEGGASWLSPTHALLLVPSLRYAAAPAEYWGTMGTMGLLSLGLLLSAGIVLTRSWRIPSFPERRTWATTLLIRPRVDSRSGQYSEHEDEGRASWSSGASPDRSQPHRRRAGLFNRGMRLLGSMTEGLTRRQLLDEDPLLWLSMRFQRGLRWTWLVVGLLIAIWIWCHGLWPNQTLAPVTVLLSIYATNGLLKLWVAWHAGHRLAEDRRSGAVEMLLCLPLDERRIWRSWLLHLKRRLFLPFAAVLLFEGALVLASIVSYRLTWNDILRVSTAFIVMAAFLVGDSYTLCWAAVSRSLSSQSSAAAMAKSLLIVLLLPLILTMPWSWIMRSGAWGLGGTVAVALVWGAVGLAIDLVVCGDAVAALTERFRSSVALAWGAPPDLKTAWKSLSASKRRGPPFATALMQGAGEKGAPTHGSRPA